jgi:DNA (cytosine-5)-methyltransferase 1
MAQIHIKLSDNAHKKLRKKAKEFNYSIQEFAEKVLDFAVREPETLFSACSYSANDKDSLFTFSDLFAGIGGIRSAFEEHDGKCVFTSEWDMWCQKTYF